MIIDGIVLPQYQLVMDRWKDGQTHMTTHSISTMQHFNNNHH